MPGRVRNKKKMCDVGAQAVHASEGERRRRRVQVADGYELKSGAHMELLKSRRARVR